MLGQATVTAASLLPFGFASVRLNVTDIPPPFADMAIVSFKGRSYSLMAQFAVDFIVRQARDLSGT